MFPDSEKLNSVPVFPGNKLSAGINKKNIAAVFLWSTFFPCPVKNQNGHRDIGCREEITRQSDHRVEQVSLNVIPIASNSKVNPLLGLAQGVSTSFTPHFWHLVRGILAVR